MGLYEWLNGGTFFGAARKRREALETIDECTEELRMLTEAIRTGETAVSRLPHKEGCIRSITLTEKGKELFRIEEKG